MTFPKAGPNSTQTNQRPHNERLNSNIADEIMPTLLPNQRRRTTTQNRRSSERSVEEIRDIIDEVLAILEDDTDGILATNIH